MNALRLLGRLALTALLLVLILVVGFYSLYASLFALESNAWVALGCVAVGAAGAGLLGWWIMRLWRPRKRWAGA